MRILITGKTGQLGYALQKRLQDMGEVIALDRSQMDLADLDQVRSVIRATEPDLIITPAAYTAVDKAESELALAMRINGEAPGVMAQEAKRLGAAIIHYSTDYVFDGSKGSPYTEDDATGPLNADGRSKLAGEQAVRESGASHLILRTSWIYGEHGNNFLKTVLRLAQARDELRIVADQYGAPTCSTSIADATACAIATLGSPSGFATAGDASADAWKQHSGLYHLTAQGETTWYGFSKAILEHPSTSRKPPVVPIATQDYPLPAARPAYSVLSSARFIKTFCALPDWHEALTLCLDGMAKDNNQ